MGRIIIVQPHSDDALFCCYSVLSRQEGVEVLTVENDPKRIAEDDKLYTSLEIPHSHLETDYKDESYYAYFPKQPKTGPRIKRPKVEIDPAINCILECWGAESVNKVIDLATEFLADADREENTIYLPAGIGHPAHIFVRHVFRSLIEKAKVIYYRDFPHSYRTSSREQLEDFRNEHPEWEEVQLSHEEWELKWSLAYKNYKSQSGLFRFEQGYIRQNLPEEFYQSSE